MTTHILYPCDSFYPKRINSVDCLWQEEFNAFKRAGIDVTSFNFDEPENNNVDYLKGKDVFYRGWMFSPSHYEYVFNFLKSRDVNMLITPEMYESTHYLPEWYPLVEDLTAETIVTRSPTELKNALDSIDWDKKYLLKDFVKSLKTKKGSIVSSKSEAIEIIQEMTHYRGEIEGGICIRSFVDIEPDTETRYFALFGKVVSKDNSAIPPIVYTVAERFKSNTISIDIAYLKNKEPYLVELGNAQVSDCVNWDFDVFAQAVKETLIESNPNMEIKNVR